MRFVRLVAGLLLLSLVGVLAGSSHTAIAAPEVTGSIKGRVKAADGGAIGGVMIRASPPGNYKTTVDASGFYTLTLPVSTDGYELLFEPVPGASFLMSKLRPGRIYFQANEVVTGTDMTLEVGGGLGGLLLENATGLPATEFSYGSLGTVGHVDARRGVINPQKQVFPPGRYPLYFINSKKDVLIEKRKTTTVVMGFDLAYPDLINVLTVVGMPNVIGLQFQGTRLPLLYSQDSGLSWQTFWQPDLLPFEDGNEGHLPDRYSVALTRRSQTDDHLRAVVGRLFVYLPDPKFALMRSGDNGETWAEIQAAPPNCADLASQQTPYLTSYGNSPFGWLKTSPTRASQMYALGKCVFSNSPFSKLSSFTVLYVSDDFGMTWQRRKVLPEYRLEYDIMSAPGVALAASMTQAGRLFFLLDDSNGVPMIEESNDAGRSWITRTTALSEPLTVSNLVADGGLTQTLYLLGSVYITTPYSFTGHFKVSNDAGLTWADGALPKPLCVSNGDLLQAIPGRAGHLLMRCGGEHFRSRDGGQSWQPLTSAPKPNQLFTDAGNPGRIYMTQANELWVSNDEGDTWRLVIRAHITNTQSFLPIVFK